MWVTWLISGTIPIAFVKPWIDSMRLFFEPFGLFFGTWLIPHSLLNPRLSGSCIWLTGRDEESENWHNFPQEILSSDSSSLQMDCLTWLGIYIWNYYVWFIFLKLFSSALGFQQLSNCPKGLINSWKAWRWHWKICFRRKILLKVNNWILGANADPLTSCWRRILKREGIEPENPDY